MLSFADALRRVLDGVEPLGAERVGLRAAAGRVLARDVVASVGLPRFDHSAMDGYAVDARDFATPGPWRLPVRGESRAGAAAPALERGSACRIFTGAPMPAGADAVILQEDARASEGTVEFQLAPRAGQNIRHCGEDLALGSVALRAGTRLGAHQLGLAAGLDQVDV
ncbi:MAG TPA: molybdopterin molybdenumtransferase MoeA, partial [Polyangiaceae bacterium]|nr:molybdopterin molybdenumtransferase MoeA [Polyangiaceae bacterium]